MKYKIMVQNIDYPMGASHPFMHIKSEEYRSYEEVESICNDLNSKDDLRVLEERKKNPNYNIYKNYFPELDE